MELTTRTINMAESLNWDDDLRQDVYVKWLEADDRPLDIDTDSKLKAYLQEFYFNVKRGSDSKEKRRREIEQESVEAITRELGLADDADDPMEVLIAEEGIYDILKDMSPLIRGTFERVIVEGDSVEAEAEREKVSANTIYQRVWEAKQTLKG